MRTLNATVSDDKRKAFKHHCLEQQLGLTDMNFIYSTVAFFQNLNFPPLIECFWNDILPRFEVRVDATSDAYCYPPGLSAIAPCVSGNGASGSDKDGWRLYLWFGQHWPGSRAVGPEVNNVSKALNDLSGVVQSAPMLSVACHRWRIVDSWHYSTAASKRPSLLLSAQCDEIYIHESEVRCCTLCVSYFHWQNGTCVCSVFRRVKSPTY